MPEPATDAAAPKPADEPKDWKSTLTPEQRAELKRDILAETDPREYAEVAGDKFNGYLGQQLQAKRPELVAEIAALQAKNALLEAERQARETRDPDKALEVVDARHKLEEAEAAVEREQQQAKQQEVHVESWKAALATFSVLDADPLLRPIIAPLSKKTYSEDPGESARAFGIDIGLQIAKTFPQIVTEIEKRTEARIRGAIEKEVNARRLTEEPPPDTGSGGAPSGDDDDAFLARFNAGGPISVADRARAERILQTA